MDEAIEKSAMRKIYIRLLPFAILSYFLAYVDRINVSFAALTMRGDLQMSATAYGFALGTFYWAYFIFEVPSNIAMEKVGARLWIARIMITWGLLACATAYVTGATSFGVRTIPVRRRRSRLLSRHHSVFHLLVPDLPPCSDRIGVSDRAADCGGRWCPAFDGACWDWMGLLGLRGWQIMYLAEGIPTLLIGIVTLFVLTDKPEQAKFLTQEEKAWLRARLDAERTAKESVRTFTLWQSMIDPKVLLLSLNYLGIVTASLGMLFFIPQIIKSIGVTSNMTVGWLTMVPYICGGIGLVVWGFVSDRMNERRWNLLVACIVSTAGLVMAGMTMGTWWALVGMSIAAVGFYGSKGPFWAMPPMFLTGTAAAAAIAWINSIGNLGGFFGPWYVGVMKDATGSFSGGLYGLALLGLISAVVCAFFLHIPTARVLPAAPARVAPLAGD